MTHRDTARHELLHILAAAVYVIDTAPQLYPGATAHFYARADDGLATVGFDKAVPAQFLGQLSAVMAIGPLVDHAHGMDLLTAPDAAAAAVLSDVDLDLRRKWEGPVPALQRLFAATRRAVPLMPMQRLTSILCAFPDQTTLPLAELFPASRLRTALDATDRDFVARKVNPLREPRYA